MVVEGKQKKCDGDGAGGVGVFGGGEGKNDKNVEKPKG